MSNDTADGFVNIAVCDDESAEAAYIASLARKWAGARGVGARLREYGSAEEYLFHCEDGKHADILLLDIQMKEMRGIELARRIRGGGSIGRAEVGGVIDGGAGCTSASAGISARTGAGAGACAGGESVQIVFVTGYPDFIAEGYDVSALHYLMKPVSEAKLFEVLDKAAARLQKTGQAPALLVQTPEATERVPLGDILYIESFAHYVAIQTVSRRIEARANIGELEKSAGGGFARCHRSYIVGLRHVSRITRAEVVLDGGGAIPLSRRLYTKVNLAFIAYHKEGGGAAGWG